MEKTIKSRLIMAITALLFSCGALFGATGDGSAVISPLTVVKSSTGNTISITFTAGTTWTTGVLKLSIPAGWPAPSTSPSSQGYYLIDVVDGSYDGYSIAGQDVTFDISGLQASTGKIYITYGSKNGGGPGATAQNTAGTAFFTIQTDTAGSSPSNISSQPSISVLEPSPTVTVTQTITKTSTLSPTPTISPTITVTSTPVTGEGTASILPTRVMIGGTGNTITIEYTAGATAWTSGGTLKVIIPSGWSVPSITGTDAGYFTASVTGGTFDGSSRSGSTIIVNSNSLNANTGKITVTYGAKGSGGPGATAQNFAGVAIFMVQSNPSGSVTHNIASQPQIDVTNPTATVTQTITPTFTSTPAFTPQPPVSTTLTYSGANVTLSWNTAAFVDSYRVYYANGYSGRLNTFPSGWTLVATVLPTPTVCSVTHNDLSGSSAAYYVVTGVNGAGESRRGTMVSRIKLSFAPSSIYRVSLPYTNKFTKASDIVADIEGNTYTSTKISDLLLWNPQVQSSVTYGYSGGRWQGVDWTVDAGTSSSNAIYMFALSSFDWYVAGTDKNSALVFTHNPGMTNSNKRSLPYSMLYTKASDIVADIEGNTYSAGRIYQLMLWAPATRAYTTWGYDYAQNRWKGVDFTILPGDSVNIYTTSSFTWTPKLVVTPVP